MILEIELMVNQERQIKEGNNLSTGIERKHTQQLLQKINKSMFRV